MRPALELEELALLLLSLLGLVLLELGDGEGLVLLYSGGELSLELGLGLVELEHALKPSTFRHCSQSFIFAVFV